MHTIFTLRGNGQVLSHGETYRFVCLKDNGVLTAKGDVIVTRYRDPIENGAQLFRCEQSGPETFNMGSVIQNGTMVWDFYPNADAPELYLSAKSGGIHSPQHWTSKKVRWGSPVFYLINEFDGENYVVSNGLDRSVTVMDKGKAKAASDRAHWMLQIAT